MNKIITTDFDGTLMLTEFDMEEGIIELGPNKDLIKMLKDFQENGDTICVVTTRHIDQESDSTRTSIEEFCLVNNFSPKYVFFTEGKCKASALKLIKSDLHFEDCPEEIKQAEANNILFIKVRWPVDKD